MEHTPLCELCIKYGTDKGPAPAGWGYSSFYFNEFNARRLVVKRVFELGICGYRDIPNNVVGASLWVWHDFFPNAQIIGVDIDAKYMVNTGRITSFIADETKPETMLGPLAAGGGKYDLIVDDAIHDPAEQLTAARTMLPFLAENGIYAMEDVCLGKLPNGDIGALLDMIPAGFVGEMIDNPKAEKLVFIRHAT